MNNTNGLKWFNDEREEQETWYVFPEYEGLYEISSLGRVRSLDRLTDRGLWKAGRVLKPSRQYNKTYVSLRKDGKSKAFNNVRLMEIVTELMSVQQQ